MIRVTIGTNTDRTPVILDPNTSLKKALEDNQVNLAVSSITLDGATLKPGDINKTFSEMGITENCFLIACAKVENATA